MLTLVTAAFVASGGASPDARPICQNTQPQVAAGLLYPSDGSAAAKRLGDLPAADLVLTVLRREDGCAKPVIVRSGIGATTVGR